MFLDHYYSVYIFNFTVIFLLKDHRISEKLLNIAGPTVDLPTLDVKEKKFAGHCRLYIGNLTNDVTDEEINVLFSPYGETAEVFVNKEKNFAFIRMVSFKHIYLLYL